MLLQGELLEGPFDLQTSLKDTTGWLLLGRCQTTARLDLQGRKKNGMDQEKCPRQPVRYTLSSCFPGGSKQTPLESWSHAVSLYVK